MSIDGGGRNDGSQDGFEKIGRVQVPPARESNEIDLEYFVTEFDAIPVAYLAKNLGISKDDVWSYLDNKKMFTVEEQNDEILVLFLDFLKIEMQKVVEEIMEKKFKGDVDGPDFVKRNEKIALAGHIRDWMDRWDNEFRNGPVSVKLRFTANLWVIRVLMKMSTMADRFFLEKGKNIMIRSLIRGFANHDSELIGEIKWFLLNKEGVDIEKVMKKVLRETPGYAQILEEMNNGKINEVVAKVREDINMENGLPINDNAADIDDQEEETGISMEEVPEGDKVEMTVQQVRELFLKYLGTNSDQLIKKIVGQKKRAK